MREEKYTAQLSMTKYTIGNINSLTLSDLENYCINIVTISGTGMCILHRGVLHILQLEF